MPKLICQKRILSNIHNLDSQNFLKNHTYFNVMNVISADGRDIRLLVKDEGENSTSYKQLFYLRGISVCAI